MKQLRRAIYCLVYAAFVFHSLAANANLPSAGQMPLNHCYHWINERTDKFLTFKYSHAQKSGGEFSFYTTAGNGAVAGPGIYCAKTLLGSYIYGDRVVRIDFVDDVVMTDNYTQVCGTNGRFYANPAECNKQPSDVYLYNKSNEWYLIKNPRAIKSWSANSPTLISDITAIKAFSDSTASAHMDMTLSLMKTEAANYKKVFINPNARLDIVDLLRDPAKVKDIPVLSLVEMIAASSKITTAEKNRLYSVHLSRALVDSSLAYGDYETLLQKYSDVAQSFKSLVSAINYTALAKYNVVVLITAIDKLNINLAADKARSIWQSLWASKTSFESLSAMKLSKDGILLKNFAAFLPANLDVSNVQDNNLPFLLNLLDAYLPSQANTYESLTEKIFDRLMRGERYYQAAATYDALKNPALNKEKAVIALFNRLITTPGTKLDMLSLGSLFDKVKSQISDSQSQKIAALINNLPIRVSSRLSYLVLEDYKSGRMKLPSTVSLPLFLDRLVERAISERTLGASTTNTYRMILSGYYSVFVDKMKESPNDKQQLMDQAALYFSSLAKKLAGSAQFSYAYVAEQNAQLFEHDMNYTSHPLEAKFAQYNSGNAAEDTYLENLAVKGMDTGFLLYLVSNLTTNDANTAKAQQLVQKILTTYISPSFQQMLTDKAFTTVNNEKKMWTNYLKNEALAPSGTVRTDLCAFNGALHDSSGILAKNFSSLWTQVDKVKNQVYANCRK